MNIRWLWGNYIEPEWKLSRKESREVHRIVSKRYVRPVWLFGFTGAWVVIVMVAVKLLHMPVAGWMGSLSMRYPFSWLASMVGIIVPLMVLSIWSYRWVYTRPVRLAMRELGYDVCPGCGYWLRGLNESVMRCPECGAVRERMPVSTRAS